MWRLLSMRGVGGKEYAEAEKSECEKNATAAEFHEVASECDS